jgi:PAS domain S-box-containing protein
MLPFSERGSHSDLILAGSEFVGLLESTPMAMLLLDAQGNVQAANVEAERLFGYNRGFLIGKAVEILLPDLFPKDSAGSSILCVTARNGHHRSTGVELQAQAKDGSRFPVRVNLAPLDHSEGTPLVVAVCDLTHVKSLEEALQKHKTELEKHRRRAEQSERFTNELLAALSAKLQPPLSAIVALAEILRKGAVGSLSAEHRRHLGMLAGAARRLRSFATSMGRISSTTPDVRISGKSLSRLCDLARAPASASPVAAAVENESRKGTGVQTRSVK